MDFASPTLQATRGRLVARFGAPVDPWWERLPEVVAELARLWKLVVGDAVGRGNTSLVVRCRRADGRCAILKLTPEAELGVTEAAALRRWEPSGRVPQVWEHDAASGALLLEAMPSETPLAERRVAVGLDEIAGLIGGLHRSGTLDGVPSLAARVDFIYGHWVERQRRRGEMPVDRLRRGHELARQLAVDAGAPVLLHGDLHPGNVLDGGDGRGLVAIDPRPCVGDAVFDAVDWVFWAEDDPAAWKPRGRALAQALGVDSERLWAWCSALAAMLAAAESARGADAERVGALLELSP